MVAFHARLDYLSQNLLKEVFVRRAQIFAHSLIDLAKLDSKDRTQVRFQPQPSCEYLIVMREKSSIEIQSCRR